MQLCLPRACSFKKNYHQSSNTPPPTSELTQLVEENLIIIICELGPDDKIIPEEGFQHYPLINHYPIPYLGIHFKQILRPILSHTRNYEIK